MGVRVFWLEPTNRYRHSLRRYHSGDAQCLATPNGMPYHDARVVLGVIEADEHPVSYPAAAPDADSWTSDRIDRLDPRWPKACACGYVFTADDAWRVAYDSLYEARGGARDGERFTLGEAPAGAMWDASWMRSHGGGEYITGPDGISLVVRLPNGSEWCVDQQASNCTRDQWGQKPGAEPGRYWLGRTHYCWVRHGDPRKGILHVDKNGDTCGAGAGSILSGSYHGFLHNSELVPC